MSALKLSNLSRVSMWIFELQPEGTRPFLVADWPQGASSKFRKKALPSLIKYAIVNPHIDDKPTAAKCLTKGAVLGCDVKNTKK